MSPRHPLRFSENETTLSAWQAEIARSATTPWLAQALAARVTDLLPRVARCHTQLRTLPRRTRRAWQRQLARSSDLTAILQDWSQRRAGRALQRQLARSVAGAALLLALAHGVGHAATITVNTNIPGINPGDGKCSLIEAIVNANDNAATHPDCAAGSAGQDIIVLPKATHALGAVNNSTYEATGLPVIASEIVIECNDAKITRRATAPQLRLIAVGATGDLTLKDVTLSGGNAGSYGGAIHNHGILTIQNSTISGNKAGYAGGGISNDGGTLIVDGSTISGNTVTGNDLGAGGGIASASGTVTITNSTISGNSAAGTLLNYGGGIVSDGSMTVENSTISGNKGRGYFAAAGGIGSIGSLTITNSTISGNQTLGKYVNASGGIQNSGTMTIQNSTISGNKAGSANAYGGGIANLGTGTATIENSTISGNKANGKYGYGGGIANEAALTITNSTISGNKAGPKYGYAGGIGNNGTLTLHRSLISGNKAGAAPEVDNYGAGTVAANDFNLFGLKGTPGVQGIALGLTDIVPGPTVTLGKILGGLKNNGGSTKTHALKLGSPAVNAVPSADPSCTGADQRGVSRPQPPGSDCDIGAFELE